MAPSYLNGLTYASDVQSKITRSSVQNVFYMSSCKTNIFLGDILHTKVQWLGILYHHMYKTAKVCCLYEMYQNSFLLIEMISYPRMLSMLYNYCE